MGNNIRKKKLIIQSLKFKTIAVKEILIESAPRYLDYA